MALRAAFLGDVFGKHTRYTSSRGPSFSWPPAATLFFGSHPLITVLQLLKGVVDKGCTSKTARHHTLLAILHLKS